MLAEHDGISLDIAFARRLLDGSPMALVERRRLSPYDRQCLEHFCEYWKRELMPQEARERYDLANVFEEEVAT